MPALDVVLDSIALKVLLQEIHQGSCVQEGLGVASLHNPSKGEIHDPGQRITGLRQEIAVKDIRRAETRPKPCDGSRGRRKIVAAYGQAGAIDRSGGGASDDGEGVAVRLNSGNLANALQNAGLISAAGTSAGHYQAEPVVHLH